MNESFTRRYIKHNAKMAWSMEAMDRSHFKNGAGLARLLLAKEKYIQEQEAKETAGFMEGGKLTIPQMQFFLTDRCTLSCKECNAFIPRLKEKSRIPWFLAPEDFKKDLHSLEHAVKKVRFFIFIGGEPFVHPQMHKLLDMAMQCSFVDKLVIISNGMVSPAGRTLEALIRHRDRLYLRVSDYSNICDSVERNPYGKLKALCEDKGIAVFKESIPWIKVGGFESLRTKEQAKEYFKICPFERCLQIWNGRLCICPKACAGYMLNELEMEGEVVNIRDPANLRQRIVEFYERDFFKACQTCLPDGEVIAPAEQANF